MGEGMASSLGLNYSATVALGLVLVAVTVSATVITVGAIPFVGLVVPNLVALHYGDNLGRTLPLVALGGASLLLACDVLGRLLIHPFEVPIGLTAVSYTHLDVYKRQVRSAGGCAARRRRDQRSAAHQLSLIHI